MEHQGRALEAVPINPAWELLPQPRGRREAKGEKGLCVLCVCLCICICVHIGACGEGETVPVGTKATPQLTLDQLSLPQSSKSDYPPENNLLRGQRSLVFMNHPGPVKGLWQSSGAQATEVTSIFSWATAGLAESGYLGQPLYTSHIGCSPGPRGHTMWLPDWEGLGALNRGSRD